MSEESENEHGNWVGAVDRSGFGAMSMTKMYCYIVHTYACFLQLT